jgi:hypothetical protein
MGLRADVPYEELDSNVVDLVRALNAFAGIKTIGSCGGHREPGPGQAREGSWWVTFEIEHSEDGWFALEFLAWLINNDYWRAGHKVHLYPTSPPPYLNEPGRVLKFSLEGYGSEDPEELAEWIDRVREESYIGPEETALD